MSYSGATTRFGFPYMQDGDTMSGAQEEAFHEGLDAILQGVLDAVGEGVIEGGVGSVVAGNLALTALKAIIADTTGGVYVAAAATTINAAEFEEGPNYVHCQLTATSRADQSCEYYVDSSPTPAADAIVICQVTVSGGAVTAVDNTVKAVPAIAARIPWEVLIRSYDDPTTLLESLTDWLGADYLGETPPDSVDERLDALEAGGGGGGGGGTVYWGGLERAVGDDETVDQAIDAAIADHLVTTPHGGSGGGGGTAVDTPWDVGQANDIKSRLYQIRSHSVDLGELQIDSMYYVPGVAGDGTRGTRNYRDDVNSTW